MDAEFCNRSIQYSTMASAVVIDPLVPSCTAADGDVVPLNEVVDGGDALAFQPNELSYYQEVLKSTIPGIVLGALTIIAMLVMIIWVRVEYTSDVYMNGINGIIMVYTCSHIGVVGCVD